MQLCALQNVLTAGQVNLKHVEHGYWLYSVTPHSLGEISCLSVIQKKRKKVKKCSNVSSIKDVFPS